MLPTRYGSPGYTNMCSKGVRTRVGCECLAFGRRRVGADAVLCIASTSILPTRRVPSGSVYISSPDDNEHDQCACGHLTPSRCRIGVNEYEGCSYGVSATLPTLCVPFCWACIRSPDDIVLEHDTCGNRRPSRVTSAPTRRQEVAPTSTWSCRHFVPLLSRHICVAQM